ncbi:acyltransferase [Polaribacter sp. BM10]|uniref:1-acyl-sn-glycerol-3-phosphate acyltransferase n=1 Tax=Polaribacter sp. BM10 TaxID=1529069 RepID=UPI00098B2AFA|nr:1-acyl-sn-glycerol-3-phosphate acyltransferase [Polaribacter sp. BM10]AQS92677.1 acyltransferase [Polaribacter sp. BM10]
MLQKIWFALVWTYVKLGLFFYSKKIIVKGTENIPKKGAVLFAVNHPNGLVDPLYVTTTHNRRNHYLVRAATFKNPIVKKILESLYLMPIYRIRDGIKQLANNQQIFDKCHRIFEKGETLIIFPEGSHDKKRTIRPLSKGFTRIVFGALEKYEDLDITVIPVGLTYQHPSDYPAKIIINYGKPIKTRAIYDHNTPAKAINLLKANVTEQLQKLTVHIPDDDNYETVLQKLNNAQVDFTEVDKVNSMILKNSFPEAKSSKKNYVKPLFYLIVLNSLIPVLIWKKVFKLIKEVEFIDTFRFSVNLLTFTIFYSLQALIIGLFYGDNVALFYFTFSVFLVFVYTKLAPTNTKKFLNL